nr:nuclear transport factor 2 family protein [Mycolicibacterium malmesburyense]CRL69584.1 SnoaL-like domain protein [Mycolicibacterium malmesburyense]
MPSTFEDRVQLAREFLDGMGVLDFDRVARYLATDAVMVLPFVEDVPATRGSAAIVDQLRTSMPAMFVRMDFVYDRWYEVAGEQLVIAEYHSKALQRGTGNIYRNTYITIFGFEGDKITLYKEYLNPLRFAGLAQSAAAGQGSAEWREPLLP